jgi:hypothetical protein
VCERATQYYRVEHARELNVIDEATPARKQSQIFETLNGAPDECVSGGANVGGFSTKRHQSIF